MPVEQERCPPPMNVPLPPPGWVPVYYSASAAPKERSVMSKLRTCFSRGKPRGAWEARGGLSATYKRQQRPELVTSVEDDEVDGEELRKMEEWLSYARDKVECHQCSEVGM